MACEYADDAYLIQAWPQVVITSPGAWLIVVAAVAAGDYTITVGGVPYVYTADGTETVGEIRGELLALVSLSLAVTAAPVGSASLSLTQVQATALTVTASGPSGPAPSEVTITTTAGGDNSAQRAFWLARAQCGVPDCCNFCSCEDDYTLFHASLAAYYILAATTTGPDGTSSGTISEMELGPARLKRSAATRATPTEQDLARFEPGIMVLMLRKRHLPPFFCR